MSFYLWKRDHARSKFGRMFADAMREAPIVNPEGALVGQAGAFGLRAWNPPRRGSKTGSRELAWQSSFPNAAVYEGLNLANNLLFKNGVTTPVATWYFGIILASPTPVLAATDVMSSHAGWSEDSGYDGGTRPTWSPGTSANGSIPTLTASSVTISGDHTVRGACLVGHATKGGTTGPLWATAIEGANRNVVDGQVLQIYYTNTFTPVS